MYMYKYSAKTFVAIRKLGWSYCASRTQKGNMTLVFEKDGEKIAAYRSGYIRRNGPNANIYTGRRTWYQIEKQPYQDLNEALDALLAYLVRNGK